MRSCTIGLFLFLFLYGCRSTHSASGSLLFNPYHYTTHKKIIAGNGAVVSAHPLASRTGVEIMKAGGNAFDAAIATQLALAVVYPGAGNIGGGGFMVARLSNAQTLALDFRETAPAAASRNMYLDSNGNVVTGKSVNGHLSVGVPGTVAGLWETLKYARLPFKKLIQPAIDLAEKGFVITVQEAAALNNIQTDLKQYNTLTPVFVKAVWQAGDTLIQTDLASTLKRIRDKGAAGFYEGPTAQLIVEEMKRGHGLITGEDLKNYKARWRTPHTFTYKGYTVVSMPMPGSGGILLHQMLKMVEDKPLAAYGFLSAEAVQLMTEVERRAFADRAEYMGDADFYAVPESTLVSDAYLKSRMNDFTPNKAGNSETIKPVRIPFKESEQTTHISIIDGAGNAVSITTTLNNSYGSKTVAGGAGFFLNDEMDDFSIKPGTPNLYGAVGGEANAIAPGKRMLSSMTPTIVLQNGEPFLVAGTPGGTTIPTSVFQTLVDIIDFKLTTEDAVNLPKFHHQWLPDRIDVEDGFPEKVQAALEKMGYKLYRRPSIGRMEVIKVLSGNSFEAVADSRGDDSAEGY
jgi:gamma-glutamyltranspeptidase/glutathione hydrolase